MTNNSEDRLKTLANQIDKLEIGKADLYAVEEFARHIATKGNVRRLFKKLAIEGIVERHTRIEFDHMFQKSKNVETHQNSSKFKTYIGDLIDIMVTQKVKEQVTKYNAMIKYQLH